MVYKHFLSACKAENNRNGEGTRVSTHRQDSKGESARKIKQPFEEGFYGQFFKGQFIPCLKEKKEMRRNQWIRR